MEGKRDREKAKTKGEREDEKDKNQMSSPRSVRKTDNQGKKSSATYQIYYSTKCTRVFLLLRIFSCLSLQPITFWYFVSTPRHHGSAFSDCLHADGCRDYARHFRFCSLDRSVSFCLCTYVYLFVGFGWGLTLFIAYRFSAPL